LLFDGAAFDLSRRIVYIREMGLLNFDSLSSPQQGGFIISTRDEAIQFEKNLHAVYDEHIECPGKIIFGLGNIFDVCHKFKKDYGSRIFAAIIDLAISQTNCTCELDDCVRVWNKYFSDANEYGNTPQSSILESQTFFEGKLYLQRYLNSFVLKYRAHWDKIMGLYFLIWEYNLYQDFIKAPKKKRMFLKIFAGHKMVDQEVVGYVDNELTLFDQDFRTHEAHNTGRLRKFAFTDGLEQSKNLLSEIVNEKYGKYIALAPKIFECVEYFLCFPAAIDKIESETKENQR
jgi:hypothetical protein